VNRLTDHAYSEAIVKALYYMPDRIVERVQHAHYFTGVDPVWAGVLSVETTTDGRSYRDTACCAYGSYGVPDQRTTVVLPTRAAAEPWVVTHELGHVLHEVVGFDYVADPTTQYSRRNRWEAFADAFYLWIGWDSQSGIRVSDRDAAFFGSLT
jgi:hypothetical protein